MHAQGIIERFDFTNWLVISSYPAAEGLQGEAFCRALRKFICNSIFSVLEVPQSHRLKLPPPARACSVLPGFPAPPPFILRIYLTPSVSAAVLTDHLPRGVEQEPETEASCRCSATSRGLE